MEEERGREREEERREGEERVGQLQTEKESVSEQLSEMVGRQGAVEEERDFLQERVGQLERQLRDTQATVEARE